MCMLLLFTQLLNISNLTKVNESIIYNSLYIQ